MYISSVKYSYRLWLSTIMFTLANALLTMRHNVIIGIGSLILWSSFLVPMTVIALFIPFAMIPVSSRSKLKKLETTVRALAESMLFYVQVKTNVAKTQCFIRRVWNAIRQAFITAWQWIVNKFKAAYNWVASKFKRNKNHEA